MSCRAIKLKRKKGANKKTHRHYQEEVYKLFTFLYYNLDTDTAQNLNKKIEIWNKLKK